MRAQVTYDRKIRQFISALYRVLLIIYGIIILNINNNIFAPYVYMVTAITHLLIFVGLYGLKKFYSKLRVLNDFVLITVFLYGKEINNLENVIFLFLPIINASNYIGITKFNTITYFFTVVAVVLLSYNNVNHIYILPLVCLWILQQCEVLRIKIDSSIDDFASVIESYNYKKYKLGSTYKIYKELIASFNTSNFSSWLVLNQIICFELKENNDLVLYDGSEFVLHYKVNFTDQEKLKLRKGDTIDKEDITVNNVPVAYALFKSINVKTEVENQNHKTYVFCFDIDIRNRYIFFLLRNVLQGYSTALLRKIVGVIYLESTLRLLRDEEIQKIKSKLAYVSNTLIVFHFMRNKFSPIQNLIKMSSNEDQFYQNAGNEAWVEFKSRQVKIAESTLAEIQDKTNYILENENNPFKVKVLKPHSARKLYSVAKRVWVQQLAEKDIKVSMSDIPADMHFMLDIEAAEIVMTDIINNCMKHSNAFRQLHFYEHQNCMVLAFSNDLKEGAKLSEFKTLIDQFNSNESTKINRKTHGLSLVKDFLDQMPIRYELSLEDKIFTFKILLKKIDNESGDFRK